nr:unnamed protein product [Digitaria exilis]
MLSTNIAAHPVAGITLRQRPSPRPRQPLCLAISVASLRQRMSRPAMVIALASQTTEGAPAAPRKLSFPILGKDKN